MKNKLVILAQMVTEVCSRRAKPRNKLASSLTDAASFVAVLTCEILWSSHLQGKLLDRLAGPNENKLYHKNCLKCICQTACDYRVQLCSKTVYSQTSFISTLCFVKLCQFSKVSG